MDLNLQTSDAHDARETFEVVDGSHHESRATAAPRAIVPTIAGSGWYHDAAIEQAGRATLEARCNPYG